MDDSDPSEITTERFPRSESAADQIRQTTFPVVAMRGYDRRAVDDFLEWVAELVRDLESRQSRETVVQRALEEVGDETTGILQRAHETADEIAARSRAQAEGRIQRAEREAEIVRRDADRYAEQVIVDTRLLWEERQRLIEDIRQLADEVLATADDAIERVKMPEPLREPDAATDSPTAEVELDVLPGGAGEGSDSEAPEEAPQPPSEVPGKAEAGDGGPLPQERTTAPGGE